MCQLKLSPTSLTEESASRLLLLSPHESQGEWTDLNCRRPLRPQQTLLIVNTTVACTSMYICNIPMCVVQACQVEYEIHSSPAALITDVSKHFTKRCAAAEQPHP